MSSGSKRYDALAVREYVKRDGSQGSQWTKIGAAFENRGGSITIQLDAFPRDGKIVLREPDFEGGQRQGRQGGQASQRSGARGFQRGRGQPQRMGQNEMFSGRQPPPQEPDYPPEFDDVPPDPTGFPDDEGP